MSFKVNGPARVVTMAGDGTSTYYVGQLVAFNTTSNAACYGSVTPLLTPSGAADTTNKSVIAGVVVGFNARTPSIDSTYKANYISGAVTSQANLLARDWAHNKGMYSIGDPQVLLDVAMVDPTTLITGPIYDASYGTAPTVVADTVGTDTTGYTSAATTGTTGFSTPVAKICSMYCRTGANAGLYRVTADTSATAPSVTVGFPYDIALGDTFVRVPFKQGLSYFTITAGMFLDSNANPASNYFTGIFENINLAIAGQEYATFRFCTEHFDNARA